MPCAQFEALERYRQAWRDGGVDSDKLTIQDEDEDKDDPQEEAGPLEARIRKTIVDMFKRVLHFRKKHVTSCIFNKLLLCYPIFGISYNFFSYLLYFCFQIQ